MGERVWGQHIESMRDRGFDVRSPGEDWVRHLVACDLLVTDHTSLCIYGALAGKAMLWSPVPESATAEGTVLDRLRRMSPTLSDTSRLGEAMQAALSDYPFEALGELAHEINSRPGQSGQLMRAAIYEALELGEPPQEPHDRARVDAAQGSVRVAAKAESRAATSDSIAPANENAASPS